VNRHRAITVTLFAAALFSIAAGLWLSVFTDREGGVTVLLLRRSPSWHTDSYGDAPRKIGLVLVRGNENGVIGEDLTRWNARYGPWALGSLALGRFLHRMKRLRVPH
jgi:hypothetical protein